MFSVNLQASLKRTWFSLREFSMFTTHTNLFFTTYKNVKCKEDLCKTQSGIIRIENFSWTYKVQARIVINTFRLALRDIKITLVTSVMFLVP